MNYYERFIGDYQRDTASLSLAEHGAFTMLLDTYYATERPLPSSWDALCRICRAFGAQEQKAVRYVVESFFPVGDDGLRHNKKADQAIAEYQSYVTRCTENGKKGGRPRKNKNHLGSENNQDGFQNIPKTGGFQNQEITTTTTTTTLNSKAFPASQKTKTQKRPNHGDGI